MKPAYPKVLTLVMTLLVVFVSISCDLFEDIVNPPGDVDDDGFIPIYEIYPGTYLTEGHTANVHNEARYLTTPALTWPQAVVGDRIYVISGMDYYVFQADFYDVRDNGHSLAVVPHQWAGDAVYGAVLWHDGTSIGVTSPIQIMEVSDNITESVNRAAVESWELPEEYMDSLHVIFLGGNDDEMRFWVAEPPDSLHGYYDPDREAKRMGPVSYDGSTAELQKTFSVPGGVWMFSVGDFNTVNMADLNFDGIAELFTVQLFGENAPTYGYIIDEDWEWRWAMRYYP